MTGLEDLKPKVHSRKADSRLVLELWSTSQPWDQPTMGPGVGLWNIHTLQNHTTGKWKWGPIFSQCLASVGLELGLMYVRAMHATV
jgi:hypothetical protein